MCEPLTLSVARRPRTLAGSLPAASKRPEGRPPHVVAKTSRGGTRRARLVGTVAGLGRRTRSEPERLPLGRPEPRGPGGQMSRSLFTCTASAPHPVACCKIDLPRQRRASYLRLSSLPCCELPRNPFRPERCASPTSATDSPNEHPLDCPIPEHTSDGPCDPPSGTDSGGGSLDGDTPASA